MEENGIPMDDEGHIKRWVAGGLADGAADPAELAPS